MHELTRAVAIFCLCAAALLISSCPREGDTTLLKSTARVLWSFKGLAAIFLMGCAVAGLAGFQSNLGLALAGIIGALASLLLNAWNFLSAASEMERAGKADSPASTALAARASARDRRP
jgi:drug/metabolite transporter (DMT)-like permease